MISGIEERDGRLDPLGVCANRAQRREAVDIERLVETSLRCGFLNGNSHVEPQNGMLHGQSMVPDWVPSETEAPCRCSDVHHNCRSSTSACAL
jgi:hypothetical protein